MRIARVLSRLNLGGPARQVLASDPLLLARGHAMRIVAGVAEPGEGDLFEAFLERGLDVVRVPELGRGVSPARDWRAARAIRRELVAFGPDVVHTHASKAGFLGRRLGGVPAGAARIHTFHGHVLEGYFHPLVSRALVSLERNLARRTDRIVAVSHATADDLVRLGVVAEGAVVVVPPGIDLDALLELPEAGAPGRAGTLRAELDVPRAALLVGVVGRLAEVKRPELAVEVFATLASRHAELWLVFVGDGAERATLERTIAALPPDVARRIRLAGARHDMPGVLADLDVVLGVSRSEGMPVSMIEAAAAGLPVVSTPVGGVPELVVHERTGFLGTTPAELAYALDQLVARPDERRAMGARARLRVAERHSAAALADRLEALYAAVVPRRGAA